MLAAALPLGACSSAAPDAATLAWREAAPEPDLRRHMLAHGLLAPNPHNRQAWLASLQVPGEISLLCDARRQLPETDPLGRQVQVGCGAFIELAVLAAAQRGVAVQVLPYPDGAPDAQALPPQHRVARLVLGAPGSATPEPLFAHVRQRHTHKGAYDPQRALPAGLAEQWLADAQRLGLSAGLVTGSAMAEVRRITREAYEIECLTPRTWLESAQLMRIGPAAIAQHRDGISLNSPMVRLLHGVGLFNPLQVPQRGSSSHERVMQRWQPFETASAYLWLASPGNARPAQLAAGRAYVRMQLRATALGLAMHPLSQALQEFAEVRQQHAGLHRLLGLEPPRHTLQMLARTGYAAQAAAPSPRRALQDLLQA